MNSRQKKLLEECLLDKKTPFNQKIGEFIKILNAGSPAPNPSSEKWIISNDEWQRYEFLGDRVLNLVAAGYLYHSAPAEREGILTKRMGVVSNETLAEIINRRDWDVSRLIPDSIGQQRTYGERVKGGALEAFIGALYGIAGYVVTQKFVLSLMSEEFEHFDPANNYIGLLQEWTLETGRTPAYV
jgi:ribonuclease-3